MPWRHEVRIEDRLVREARKTYPVCTGGDGACPPEDCGGPESFMDHRNDWLSFEAFEDLDTMVEVLQEVVQKDASEKLALDRETRWRLEDAVERARAREEAQGRPFSWRDFNARLRAGEHHTLMHQRGEALGAPLREQVGGKQCGCISLLLPDAGDQCVSRRIGQLIEPALQRCGCRFGVKMGGGDALVSEETLKVSDVHAERKQAGCHRVTQQMWVDALADAGGNGDGADDLPDPLARQHVWRWP
jgi:hypothetical protein